MLSIRWVDVNRRGLSRLAPGAFFIHTTSPNPLTSYPQLQPRCPSADSGFHPPHASYDKGAARQLDREIASLAYQRTRGARSLAAKDDTLPAGAHVRDPFVLAFLNLKENIRRLSSKMRSFAIPLGTGHDFSFVARQKRIRVGTEWYRVDLVFFHRWLRALIIVDLNSANSHMPMPAR